VNPSARNFSGFGSNQPVPPSLAKISYTNTIYLVIVLFIILNLNGYLFRFINKDGFAGFHIGCKRLGSYVSRFFLLCPAHLIFFGNLRKHWRGNDSLALLYWSTEILLLGCAFNTLLLELKKSSLKKRKLLPNN
jgi:hypothetical protein